MKKNILIAAITIIPTIAFASFSDQARITDITSKYNYKVVSEPYQDCQIKDVYTSGPTNSTNKLAGGILGGVIGNQFGGGDGKKALTIAGALLGASMSGNGEELSRGETREVCTTRYREKEIRMLSHYDVTVIYNNNEITFKTKRRPTGRSMDVLVDVYPNF